MKKFNEFITEKKADAYIEAIYSARKGLGDAYGKASDAKDTSFIKQADKLEKELNDVLNKYEGSRGSKSLKIATAKALAKWAESTKKLASKSKSKDAKSILGNISMRTAQRAITLKNI